MKIPSSSSLVFTFLILSPTVLLLLQHPVGALPLYTNSRWIVDENGSRVKLACVNWVSHLKPMLAEGLSQQPLDVISKRIISMGFNCVRLTWPTFMVTNDSLASMTVRQSFQSLGLLDSIAGIQVNNPSLLDLSVIQAFQVVVSNLGDNNVMVILDNQVSKPLWCCNKCDGNGFFGDKYFKPDIWLEGLSAMATMFNGTSNVVAMSLRNELRGPRENTVDWYRYVYTYIHTYIAKMIYSSYGSVLILHHFLRYMQKGAETVHAANPNVLVIFSGLNFDSDLSFLRNHQVKLTFNGKLVFEFHWYSFTNGNIWENGNPNQVCGSKLNNVMTSAGFLLEQGWPLFVSEFGVDQSGTNVNDNRFFNCFFGIAAELDWDWALWTLVGSYYIRQGVSGVEETYGVLNYAWNDIQNPSFLQRISTLQTPFQGPGVSNVRPYNIILHPLTGLCVVQSYSVKEPLRLGSCVDQSEAWSYTREKNTLGLKGTYFCLQADGLGKPAKLGVFCSDATSKWEAISDSKLHLSSKLINGTTVCLDIDSNNTIVTNSCKCLSKDHTCDPASQWFKIITSLRT
ncbi:hypothetical protein NE237_008181 [Protea cynaroides]|uniref:Glycoside hydrolase family 5 domain-containing protein n=1 Tax=Protea cynaroides TaxID=273540 RepID=A0A9Q0KQK1_9MAGN|nr:hypothetical protein NE237_008181 [Protea cynaroides]